MATDVTTAQAGSDSLPAARPADRSIGELVGGILGDAQKLIEHQFALLKIDLRKDLDRAKEGGMMLGFGIGMLAAGGMLLLFMLVHLLEWLTRPNLEWWACFGLVGGAIAFIGGAVFYYGKKKIQKLNIVPEQAAQGLEENLQWKTNRT